MNKSRLVGAVFISLSTLGLAQVGQAALVTYAYEGTADTVSTSGSGVDSTAFDALLGQTMRIVYTFDPSTPDLQPLDTLGTYEAVSVRITIGELSYSASLGSTIIVSDNYLLKDQYGVTSHRSSGSLTGPDVGGLAVNSMGLGLVDYTQTVYNSDVLPLTQPIPDDFPSLNNIVVSFWDSQTQSIGDIAARGDVTIAAVVPIPAAIWLFGSGLLGLVGMARRNTA